MNKKKLKFKLMEIKTYNLQPVPIPVLAKDENDDIYLKVKIGNGQIGGNIVTIEDEIVAKGDLSEPKFLGLAKDLKDKEIVVRTNVLDVNPYTNMCVNTTTFKNQDDHILFSKIDRGEAPENGVASFIGIYMVKVLLLCILFFFCRNAYCQTATFNDMEIPVSPGLILLDESPSAIEKPVTPQGAGISMLGFFQGGAFEFAPFWLKDHPNLTAEQMYQNHWPFLYTLSFSAASANLDSGRYICGGIRARIYQKYSKSLLDSLDNIKKRLEIALADMDMELVEELRDKYTSVMKKPVFCIEAAAALGGSSPKNNANNLDVKRWGAWMLLHWRPKGDDFYVSALSRYLYNAQFEQYSFNAHLVDAGARLNYDINDFCMSVEYLQRMNLTDNKYNDYRIAMVGSYKASENLYLTATFGKNYTEVNNLITLIGVNIGFSDSKIKTY